MNKAMLAILTEAERLLIAETEGVQLAGLDEDQASALHTRILRSRNKYVGIYRRNASVRVPERGGRGKARVESGRDRAKAEVFEDALARVSRRLAVLASESARALREDRLAAARTAKSVPASTSHAEKRSLKRSANKAPLRTPISEKKRAAASGKNASWQAKRDAK